MWRRGRSPRAAPAGCSAPRSPMRSVLQIPPTQGHNQQSWLTGTGTNAVYGSVYCYIQSIHPDPSPSSGPGFSQCKCTVTHTNISLLCLLVFTAHQRSCEKVIISVVCVSLSVHRSGGPHVLTAHLFELVHLGLPRTFSNFFT